MNLLEINGARYDVPKAVYDAITALSVGLNRLHAVEALIDHARKISPSPSMHVYVADLERALGMDAPRPHKTGTSDA